MANFEDLSDDILYLILHCFHDQRLSALHSFRLVSKQLSAFADSVLYRVVVLEDQGEKREQATYRFIERLLDPTDILRSHVRSLHVKSFYGDDQSACMNVQLLAACLRSIEKLHAFSWGSEIPLPDDLLHALHRHHPDAQLCLSSRQFDQAALASSQLHRLSVSIPCFDLINPVSVAPFEQLRQILTNDSNIRRLSMDVHIDAEAHALPQGTYAARSTPDTIQLRLEPTDRLPSLEELVIKPHTYYFAREHCTRLYQCMDWTKLKRLKLGTSNSVAFLLTFTGKLPHLEHLDFSFHFKPEAYSPYFDRDRLVSCCDFMTSLNMLTVLIVRCDAIDLSNIFWHLLATTHGKRLQQLSLRSCFDALEAPSYRLSIRGFLTAFQNLTRLEVDFPTWNGPCYNFQGTPYSLYSVPPLSRNSPYVYESHTAKRAVTLSIHQQTRTLRNSATMGFLCRPTRNLCQRIPASSIQSASLQHPILALGTPFGALLRKRHISLSSYQQGGV
ncbi:hypothetical protein CC86DRAFT_143063 [Ophiobolus disseminans]|uniref:F-box domain-containing protein n=1 Tax=Ophiobolus disseminans TaxID=1469910 RepID=A0A6A7AGG1_9PLEO|nr:hypothetical protein CC86DRAFT_143063 [Ophiobolus disseminans]